jgi:hypothetical protein
MTMSAIDISDATRMYARACRSWWGGNAVAQARLKAEEHRRQGDVEGVDVWAGVAAEVARLDASDEPYRLPFQLSDRH